MELGGMPKDRSQDDTTSPPQLSPAFELADPYACSFANSVMPALLRHDPQRIQKLRSDGPCDLQSGISLVFLDGKPSSGTNDAIHLTGVIAIG